MHSNDAPNPPDDFEGTDEEKQQLENELLKLKMQAELGAHFGSMPGSPGLPADVERQFLEQIMAFHQQRDASPPVPVRAYLGNPSFRPAAELSEEELETEWARLRALYDSKELGVDFLAEYPLAVMYDFMTGELMDEEVEPMPGWRFIYEEFHPNHDYDQRSRTEEFMRGFFEGEFHEHFLSPSLITDDGRQLSLPEAQALLDRFHGMFDSIRDPDYSIQNTSAQTDEEMRGGPPDMPRLGFTEGMIRYTAVSHDGHTQKIVGPFKLYMECRWDWWSVMHFYMHGFSWKAAGD